MAKIGFSKRTTGDDTYAVLVHGLRTAIRVRKVHGVWRYRLSPEGEWIGTYATRIEAGTAGLNHEEQLARLKQLAQDMAEAMNITLQEAVQRIRDDLQEGRPKRT